jgi:hypothetical protein
MSPATQQLFMQQIAPILMAAVPRAVAPVGAEDADELVQDAMATACDAVDSLERRGKRIIAKSVAYYAIQRLKSGRRSTGSGRTDVMSPGCRLDGNCSLTSMDEPLRAGDGTEGPTLGDAIAGRGDDPSQMAVRNADWSEFMCGLDAAQRYIVRATAEGESLNDQAAWLQVSAPAACQRRHTIGRRARQFWGDTVLADAQAQPLWRRQMQPR